MVDRRWLVWKVAHNSSRREIAWVSAGVDLNTVQWGFCLERDGHVPPGERDTLEKEIHRLEGCAAKQ